MTYYVGLYVYSDYLGPDTSAYVCMDYYRDQGDVMPTICTLLVVKRLTY